MESREQGLPWDEDLQVSPGREAELAGNLEAVKEKVAAACVRAGRDPAGVLLLPVSKTKPMEDILALYRAGVRDFGENYVQELAEKHERLPKDIRWHMIGHLQRNKVKYIAPFVYMIHSVDSERLALTIEKEAEKCGRVIPVLLEVNVAGEETKFGLDTESVRSLWDFVSSLPHLSVQGLMTSAPLTGNPEEDRPVFRKMRQLSVDMPIQNDNNGKAGILSMGMSNDYEIAVEEGSSCVRVGTSIFGARQYNRA